MVYKKLVEFKKIVGAVLWGFKNLEDILRLISSANDCGDCSESPSEGEDYCSEHRAEYERIVENDPW